MNRTPVELTRAEAMHLSDLLDMDDGENTPANVDRSALFQRLAAVIDTRTRRD